MANLTRSPKSGSDWTFNDLMSYNITVTPQLHEQFFRQNSGPLLEDDENISDATFEYLGHLHLATNPTQESFMDAFAREALHILDFIERGLILNTHHSIPLQICGDDRRVAQIDVCLLDLRSMILLVLQADKTAFNASHPEPQVIAAAIAAYRYNDENRLLRSLSPLDAMTVPCISMVGTRPIFYLVPVTKVLSNAVATGQYPEVRTTVVRCVTSLKDNSRVNEGTETPMYRRIAFEHFLTFKALAKKDIYCLTDVVRMSQKFSVIAV